MSNTTPSVNPADNDSLNGLFRFVLSKFLQGVDDMLPAQVIAYDAATNMATVQPLITIVTTGGEQVQRAMIASIPVYQISAGGFIIRLPVNPGDTGWIKSNDRDISQFMATGEISPPNTYRKHNFSDSIFLPQTLFKNATIAGGDVNNLVIQNYAGTVKISMSETAINIVANTTITITAPTSITLDTPNVIMTGVFTAQNSGSEGIAGTIEGALSVIDGDVTADTISLKNHTHPVTTAPGETGGPTG